MPRVVDHDERRRTLALAACAVIARSGLAGATMRDVAAEAGCTTGMVSHYFADKDQLLVAALGAATSAVAQRITRTAAERPGDLVAVLAESLPLDDVRRREWRVWTAFWGAAVGNPALAREHAARYARWRGGLATVLAEEPWAGAVHEDAAETVMTAVDGIGLHAVFEPQLWPAERQLAHLNRVVEALKR
ncbi:TetR/AcrR family transcriptional regulator [Actinomycetes bacterium KLBMP 9759]